MFWEYDIRIFFLTRANYVFEGDGDMGWQVNNEAFEGIIVSEYYDNDNRRVSGIYNTVDDSAVVVNIGRLERLLAGANVVGDGEEMSFEEVERRYGEEIIKKFLAAHGVSDIFTLEEVDEAYGSQIVERHSVSESSKASSASRENQKKAVQAAVEKSRRNQAVIIKAALEGLTKQEIEYGFGYSRPTINKALKVTGQEFKDIWLKYRRSIFNGVDMKLYADFISCGCDYKEYMKYLSLNHGVSFREKVGEYIEEQEAAREEEEWLIKLREEAEADLIRLNKIMIENGRKPLRYITEKYPVAEEEPVEKSIIEQVMDIMSQPDEPIRPPVFVKPVADKNDKFVERYSQKVVEPMSVGAYYADIEQFGVGADEWGEF